MLNADGRIYRWLISIAWSPMATTALTAVVVLVPLICVKLPVLVQQVQLIFIPVRLIRRGTPSRVQRLAPIRQPPPVVPLTNESLITRHHL